MSEPKTCCECGSLFRRDVRNTYVYWSKAKYCSRACFGRAHSRKSVANRPPMHVAFDKWVSKGDGCWEWRGARDKGGYGIFSYNGKALRAAVIALQLDGRPVAKGMYACHHCDNPCCVRPDHLYPGTPTQNMADAIARGRIKLGKKAKLTTNDVIAIRSAEGTHDDIASSFGVSRPTISLIRARRTWRNVP